MALQRSDDASALTQLEAYYNDFFSRSFPLTPLPRLCSDCRNTEAQIRAQANRITSLSADKKVAKRITAELRAKLALVKRARDRRARDVDALQMDKRLRIHETKYLRAGWIATQAFITAKQLKAEYVGWHRKFLEIPEESFLARRCKDVHRDDVDYPDSSNAKRQPRNK